MSIFLDGKRERGTIAYLQGLIYRVTMRVAHRFNWHYAPPIYPENDVQLWCKWCGFRQTIKKGAPRDNGPPFDIEPSGAERTH